MKPKKCKNDYKVIHSFSIRKPKHIFIKFTLMDDDFAKELITAIIEVKDRDALMFREILCKYPFEPLKVIKNTIKNDIRYFCNQKNIDLSDHSIFIDYDYFFIDHAKHNAYFHD